jgi:pimeloyl-ACP methyl ester carboxylesterase
VTSEVAWRQSTLSVAGTEVRLWRAGAGKPVLVLHHDFGSPERLPFYDALAASFDVIRPEHPGFGISERPEWMRSARDLAMLYRELLAELGIAKASLVGLGFGGWLAAEMATMAPKDLDKLVLVGAMGVQPDDGYIFDQALVGYIDYARAAFHQQAAFDAVYGPEPTNDQLELWDICREMCFRIAWKPYMYSQTLPNLLLNMAAPALLVWGAEDQVVPRSAADIYLARLPDARLEIVAGCGHAVDMEKPEVLAGLVADFVGA